MANVASGHVKVTTADDFVAATGITSVDLVKIDTETTEDDVIAGMLQTIERDHPAIICEVLEEKTAGEIERLLAPHEYGYYLFSGDGLIPYKHIRPHPLWRNFLFISEKGAIPFHCLT